MGILMETQMSFRFVIVSFTFGETFIKLFLGEVQIARHLMEQWRWNILQQFLKTATEAFQLPNCQRRDDLFGHNGGSVSWWEPPSISEGWHGFALPLLFHINILNGLIPWKSYVYPFVSSLCKLQQDWSWADCETFGREGAWVNAGMLQAWQPPTQLMFGFIPATLPLRTIPYLLLYHCIPYHTWHSSTMYTVPYQALRSCLTWHFELLKVAQWATGSDGIPVPDPTRSFFQLPDPSRPENWKWPGSG